MKNNRVKFYTDETKDDFQKTKTSLSVTVDGNYDYLPNSFVFRFFSFIFYYFIAIPILSLVSLFVFPFHTKGRKNLRKLKKQGYFIYANHTHFKDSWMAPISLVPFRKVYIVCNKDAIQIPVIDKLVKAAGGLPVADTIAGLKNMNQAIKQVIEKNKVVMIYPEAHIWYFYTKIRPFPVTSFKFAAQSNVPAVPVAVCYKKKKLFGEKRKPKTVVYIGEPIYPKAELSEKENAIYLRDQVFAYIQQTIEKESTYSYYQYIKTETVPTVEIANKNKELAEQIEIQENKEAI